MKFQVYRDHQGGWRWRLTAANGNIVADSGQGYSSKQSCLHGIDLVRGTTNIPIIEDD